MLTDFAVQIKDPDTFTILQLTDMQIIDEAQQRRDGRLRPDEEERWRTGMVVQNCYDPIRRSVALTHPDLIIVTGDIIYGEFDDAGTALDGFLGFMGSLGIPWAPVFGNHDNESRYGVLAQCEKYTGAKNCLFARGHVTGNSNYTVGLYQGNELVRVLYMMDSNACYGGEDPLIAKITGPAPDQMAWLRESADTVTAAAGHTVPGFVCLHIPPLDMIDAVVEAGYQTLEECTDRQQLMPFSVGKPAPNCDRVVAPHTDGDCGCKREWFHRNICSPSMADDLKKIGADGVFCGHLHKCNLSVAKDGIRYTCGVKCGDYDYRTEGQLGCTKISFSDHMKKFSVTPIYHG